MRADRGEGLQRRRHGLQPPAGYQGGDGAQPALAAGALDGLIAVFTHNLASDLKPYLGEQLGLLLEQARKPPPLLDRRGLAEALGCGLDLLDKLRCEGLPQLLLGDVPRFELTHVLAWLRARNEPSK